MNFLKNSITRGENIVITAKRHAKKIKAERRRKIELQQKLEALTDVGFLDRATRG